MSSGIDIFLCVRLVVLV